MVFDKDDLLMALNNIKNCSSFNDDDKAQEAMTIVINMVISSRKQVFSSLTLNKN